MAWSYFEVGESSLLLKKALIDNVGERELQTKFSLRWKIK